MVNHNITRREKIKTRSRQTLHGTADRPRLCVFRSTAEIYVQLINDDTHTVIASSSSLKKGFPKVAKTEKSKLVGKEIGEIAKAAGITTVVFDRNGFLYHGRVKAVADAAREAGLNF
jgi:large subunit ribosomal protein L18